ncbi:4-(cytidine 5'-diphospho)-2-C-methyl-D-erythritol kinase [Halocynthiibacter sp.]|uniref:4-(cytidine 5'-diphospho)-2-C-methyl-D-erythritol kinase n=1 Tax=Halocynthiibacter sp. TaxID=1979210 RepID=UPI003C522AE2
MISERFDAGFAPAKINLALHITGQRADGYHLLDSLVAFATVGDQLHAQSSSEFSLSISGTEAAGVPEDDSNLILRAARLCDGPSMRFHLEKHLPTASGIGGGSSDAAAAVRLMNAQFDRAQMLALGADIPMCLTPVTAHVQGIGENITAVPDMPDMHAVLVNPRISVSTPAIFKALTSKDNSPMSEIPTHPDDFLPWLADQRNDLQKPAEKLFPEITHALSEMQNTRPDLTRMSGSGATCFALYTTANQARAAAQDLLQAHPDWWVKSCILGSIETQNTGQNG